MGADKNHILLKDKPLVLHVVEACRVLCSPVILAGRQGQVLPAGLEAIHRVDDDGPISAGPFHGVINGLRVARELGAERAFVLACDMPFVKPEILAKLDAALTTDADAAVPLIDGRRQPFGGIYRTSVPARFPSTLPQGKSPSLMSLLDDIRCVTVEVADLGDPGDVKHSLSNINSSADYEAAERWLEGDRDKDGRERRNT